MKNIYSLNEEAYERDLEAISQKRRFVSDWDKDFDKCFLNARFDYIVMEKPNDKLLDLTDGKKIYDFAIKAAKMKMN